MGTEVEPDPASQAASQLRLLAQHFTQYPVTGRTGTRRATAATPGTPLNLTVVDHIRASVAEVEQHTRAAAPEAGPLPAEAAAVYEWCRSHTAHADETVRRRRDTLIYRQQLEHAIRLGDTTVVRRHRCPGCGTVGLHWRQAMQRAVCRNQRCRAADGGVSAWTLAHLAHEHIEAQEVRVRRAT
ncbi:hypothetical protein [Streptomyces sp. Da 82-17]|uniref:hypothetical protein n=1 Tax=Streptomyces sp. Da 82-17 TaxID=3377116 RepID=UPI0038D4B03D